MSARPNLMIPEGVISSKLEYFKALYDEATASATQDFFSSQFNSELQRILSESSSSEEGSTGTDGPTFMQDVVTNFEAMNESITSIAEMTAQSINGIFDSFSQGVTNAFVDLAMYGGSASDKFKAIGQTIRQQVLTALIQIPVQMAVNWAKEKAIEVAKTAFFGAKAAVEGTAEVTQVTGRALAASNLAAINAFSSTAAIPIVGPALAPAAAAAALAATTGFSAAAIAGASTAAGAGVVGQAHDGIDFVPNEGTWNLAKGERVLGAKLNQDMTDFLKDDKGGSGQNVNISFKVDAVDASSFNDHMEARRDMITAMVRDAVSEEAQMGF